MIFTLSEHEKNAYEKAENTGKFDSLQDGEAIGFAGSETMVGQPLVVFMALSRMVGYQDPEQSVLVVTKQGNNRDFQRFTRQTGNSQ